MNMRCDTGKVPLLPVVVPVYGRDDVFSILGTLRSQKYADSLRFFIIDNGNGAELSGRLRALAGKDCETISFPENRGGSAAYMAGVSAAMERFPDAPYIWLLDDDAKPDAHTLPALLETMESLIGENPRTACVGSTQLSADDPSRIVECGARYILLLGLRIPFFKGRLISETGRRTRRIDYAAACSLLLNTAAVRECGFWEDVFIHFDDIEWGLRVKGMGWSSYATTESTVVHPEGGVAKSGSWISYYDSRNLFWLASKYGRLYVAAARFKDFLKDIRDRLRGNAAGIAYRKLARADFRAGLRRSRAEVLAAVEGEGA